MVTHRFRHHVETHNWFAVTVDLMVVIVGVLIALSLDQFMQRRDWQAKVRAARESMRTELTDDNGPQIYQRAIMHPCAQERLDAIRAAVTYAKSVADGHKKYLLLATDGEPSCFGTSKDSSKARTDATQAVADALSAGLPTYVVGVATTKDSATKALNAMANAGGAAITGSSTQYYLASSRDALVAALQAIAGDVSKTCVFNLEPPPPAPDFIAVKLAGETISRDPSSTNGWEYTNANHTALEIFGAACDTLRQSSDAVEIVYGCLGVVPK